MTREEAFQEFWDNAMYPSLKPNISEAAKAVAMAALKQPERVRGHWIWHEDAEEFECSYCHDRFWRANFCPNCGAIMNGKDDAE